MDASTGALHIEVAGLQSLIVCVQGPLIGRSNTSLSNEIGCLAGFGEISRVFRDRRLSIESLSLDDLLDGIVTGSGFKLELSGQILTVYSVLRFP